MNSKKHGNASSLAEEAKEDFMTAAECTLDLLEEFDAMGLGKGPALGGALTQILTHLIAVSPDTQTAMGMLSSCISNAAFYSDNTIITHPSNDEIH